MQFVLSWSMDCTARRSTEESDSRKVLLPCWATQLFWLLLSSLLAGVFDLPEAHRLSFTIASSARTRSNWSKGPRYCIWWLLKTTEFDILRKWLCWLSGFDSVIFPLTWYTVCCMKQNPKVCSEAFRIWDEYIFPGGIWGVNDERTWNNM